MKSSERGRLHYALLYIVTQ